VPKRFHIAGTYRLVAEYGTVEASVHAVRQASEGKLHGTVLKVTDEGTPDEVLAPVRDAEVSTGGVVPTRSDEIGYYSLLVAPGEHQVTAALGVFTGSATCSVEGGGHTDCDITIREGEDPGVEPMSDGGCAAGGATDRIALLLLGLGLLVARVARRR